MPEAEPESAPPPETTAEKPLPYVVKNEETSGEFQEQIQSFMQGYDEQVDWDDIDDRELEWLEESVDDISYDELMYQLNQGQRGSAMSEYGGGYWQPYSRPGEKMFVSARKQDSKRFNQAVSAAQQVDQLVLVMHVFASRGQQFNGAQIQSAMKAVGLRYGDMGLFHAYTRASNFDEIKRQQRVFSVANALEPGSFEQGKLDSLHTPGVTLLLQLPGPIDNNAAFDWFYRTGKELAHKLNGILCDESRNAMTQQCLNHMKDKISDFNIKLQLSHHPRIH